MGLLRFGEGADDAPQQWAEGAGGLGGESSVKDKEEEGGEQVTEVVVDLIWQAILPWAGASFGRGNGQLQFLLGEQAGTIHPLCQSSETVREGGGEGCKDRGLSGRVDRLGVE
jgi:hypothetical protein